MTTTTIPANTTFSNPLTLGSYVVYKGQMYIAVRKTGNKVLIMNPDSKVQVNRENLMVMPIQAQQITYQGFKYLLTRTGHVISLRTYRFIKRKDIIDNVKINALTKVVLEQVA